MSLLDRTLSRRRVAVTGAAATSMVAVAGLASTHPAFAKQAEATPAGEGEGGPGLPPIPEGATVFAEGLWNPGNIVFGPDGTLYIDRRVRCRRWRRAR